MVLKEPEDMRPEDFQAYPVWEFALDMEDEYDSDTMMRPVLDLPVENLRNRVAGTEVRLANGQLVWAMLGSVDNYHALSTSQFIALSAYNDKWIHLERYFDGMYDTGGPASFAKSLGLKIEEVFPIAYDLRSLCSGDPECLAGTIDREPRQRLSDDERRQVLNASSDAYLLRLAATVSGRQR